MKKFFHRLPYDLQRYVADYLPLYIRLGLEYSDKWIHSVNKYYSKIRMIPRGMRSNLTREKFYLRHAKKNFEWSIDYTVSINGTMDIWNIKIFDQWKYGKIDHQSVFNAFIESAVCWHENPDAIYSDQDIMVLTFIRDPPNKESQSRQDVLNTFHRMIIDRYKPELENIFHKKKVFK